MRPRRYNNAFTLIEMSLVVAVLGILATLTLTKLAQDTRLAKSGGIQTQMDRIERSLEIFAAVKGRLPCPADGRIGKDTSADFGIEASTTPGSGCDLVFFDDGVDTVGGVLPVRALAPYGLTDDDLFDPWDGEIGYFVSKTATATNAFTSSNLTTPDSTPRITVEDSVNTANIKTAYARAVIISFGQDGHGAYQISGNRKSSGSNNNDELKNCHCDNTATATTFDNIFVQHAGSSTFDDTVRYYVRSDFH